VLVHENGTRAAQALRHTELHRYWHGYLESLARDRDRPLVTVSLGEAERGARGTPRRLPLHAIGYEAESDEIQVTVGLGASAQLRYLVSKPRSIDVEELADHTVLRVADAAGMQTVFRLFDRVISYHGGPPPSDAPMQNVGGAPMS
jgi:hypothetical protein